jgi:hypothetical protein
VAFVCLAIAFAAQVRAAETGWRAGRIVSVVKDVNTKTLYWLVNTPVTQDEVTYRIVVHVGRTFVTGSYEVSKVQGEPPKEWVKDYPLNMRTVGSDLYLVAADGEQYKLHLERRKPAPPMEPITKEIPAKASSAPAPLPVAEDRPIGIGSAPAAPEKKPEADEPAPDAAAAPTVTAPPPSPEPTGIVSVRTTPYLAEVYVDGNDMGYTPAKLSLRPGKHTIRFEKHGYKDWTKEITLTAGSEQLVDATLEGK